MVKVGQKARRLWQALNTAGLAPTSWGKASKVAYTYFNGEMLNEPEFEFFRYCEGNWKITRWATKAYASWKHNHLKLGVDDGKTPCTNKRKRQHLDNLSLQIGDEMSENTVTATSEPIPVETCVETCETAPPIQFDSDTTWVRPSPSHMSAHTNIIAISRCKLCLWIHCMCKLSSSRCL